MLQRVRLLATFLGFLAMFEETTTVVAEAPLLRTDSSEVGTVIDERAIVAHPVTARSFCEWRWQPCPGRLARGF